MSKNIIVAIKTLQDVKDLIESEDVKGLLAQMANLQSFLERFKDIDHLSSKLKELETLVYVGKEFLTIAEAAKYMGVSTSKVYKMTSSGELTVYRLTGKMVYLLRDEINAVIRKSRSATDAEIKDKAELEAQKYMLKDKAAKNSPSGKKGGKA